MNAVLNTGDIFSVEPDKNDSLFYRFIGWGINLVQGVHDQNDADPSQKSTESHCGIILNPAGDTFESKAMLGRYNLNDYKGRYIRIYRNVNMTIHRFDSGWQAVKVHDGQIYPLHRWALFLLPGLAKHFAPLPKPVCSELVCKFLRYAGLRPKGFWGVDVDELFDEIRLTSEWILVYEGIWA